MKASPNSMLAFTHALTASRTTEQVAVNILDIDNISEARERSPSNGSDATEIIVRAVVVMKTSKRYATVESVATLVGRANAPA